MLALLRRLLTTTPAAGRGGLLLLSVVRLRLPGLEGRIVDVVTVSIVREKIGSRGGRGSKKSRENRGDVSTRVLGCGKDVKGDK